MTVGRFCSREVYLAQPEETVQSAARRMLEFNVGTLVVLNEDRVPIGILTDRDLTMGVVAKGRSAYLTSVADVMTRHPQVVREETPIEDAIASMCTGPFRRLPVVDGARRLAGLLSLDDVVGLLAEEIGNVGRVLEKQNPYFSPHAG